MRLLLDTHTLIWYITKDTKLSQAAKNLIDDTANFKTFSMGSLWEIAIKVNLNKLNLGETFETFLAQLLLSNVGLLGVRINHTIEVAKLPQHHRDPFDRLLIAQALTENLTILSRDVTFDLYGINRIW